MNKVVNIATGKRLSRSRRPVNMALVVEITEALECYGGHAHRDTVIEHIARARSLKTPAAHERLREEVLAVFNAHTTGEPGEAGEMQVRPTFGPDSHRWSVVRRAAAVSAEAASRV